MKTTNVPEIGVIRPSQLQVSGRTLDQFRATLKIGDVLRGRIVGHLERNKAVVNFRGFNIVTEMAVPPNRGSVIQARVLSIGDQITMRLIPGDATGVQSSASVADLLRSLDVPVTSETQAFVKALVQHNFPVTRENLESLNQYAALFHADTNVSTELITLSWALNLPPNSHLFDALRSLFGERERIGTQLQNLRALITGLLADTPEGLDPQLVRNLAQFIDQAASSNVPQRIQQYMAQLGLGYEARLFAAIGDTKLLRAFLQRSHRDVKGLLLRLRAQIRTSQGQSNLPTSTGQQLEEAREAVDGILRNIDAHEIALNHRLVDDHQFYLQIPYWLGNQPGTAEILGRSLGAKGNRRFDPENMQLELLIETVHLGTLKIHLHTLRRQMNCTILAENLRFRDFIDNHKADLLSRMRALNYRMEDIRLRVGGEDAFRLEPIAASPVLEGEFVRIDVSA